MWASVIFFDEFRCQVFLRQGLDWLVCDHVTTMTSKYQIEVRSSCGREGKFKFKDESQTQNIDSLNMNRCIKRFKFKVSVK